MDYVEGMEGGRPIFHVIESEWTYTEKVSLGGFLNRTVRGYLRAKDPLERERCCWEKMTAKGFAQRTEQNPRIPVVRHKTTWDFYNYIGYDHKNSSTKKVIWK